MIIILFDSIKELIWKFGHNKIKAVPEKPERDYLV